MELGGDIIGLAEILDLLKTAKFYKTTLIFLIVFLKFFGSNESMSNGKTQDKADKNLENFAPEPREEGYDAKLLNLYQDVVETYNCSTSIGKELYKYIVYTVAKTIVLESERCISDRFCVNIIPNTYPKLGSIVDDFKNYERQLGAAAENLKRDSKQYLNIESDQLFETVAESIKLDNKNFHAESQIKNKLTDIMIYHYVDKIYCNSTDA